MIALDARLKSLSTQQSYHDELVKLFDAIAYAATEVAKIIAKGGPLGDVMGYENADGDTKKALDVMADDVFLKAARKSSVVASYCSEEQDVPVVLNEKAPLVVAIDPLDGSSNIDVNASIGTIISVLANPGKDLENAVMQRGDRQLAAAFFVYGPQTTLYLTLGAGTDLYQLDPDSGAFILVEQGLEIPEDTNEYAINASNARHWFTPIQRYISDLLMGENGPRERNFNMRWVGSLVADAARIFTRGGVFLYPGDRRVKYDQGRLRLIYEANPVAFLTEQAGGAATDGSERILEKIPTEIHERTPLVFGSKTEVRWIGSYEAESRQGIDESPLFGHRNLFRS